MPKPLLRLDGVSISFGSGEGALPLTTDVSFDVARGESVALVGESGSGKSITAMSVLRLLPPGFRTTGTIELAGERLDSSSEARIEQIRGNDVGFVFQEPMTALNPVYTIGRSLAQALTAHGPRSGKEVRARSLELLRIVAMPDPERRIGHYPHQLSGGQRQRAMIAMAIANEPRLLIADEPTTALDVIAQATILDLIEDLRSRLDMALLMITHDMGVVADVADRVVVMNQGRVVEVGTADGVFTAPAEDYTRRLIASVPHLGTATVRPRVAGDDDRPHDAGLVVKGLDVEYGGSLFSKPFRAVDDVTFQVRPGEAVALVGESGSGKSTIGRVMAGLVKPSGGTAHLNGVSMTSLLKRDQRLLRRTASMVFQDPASSLNPRATIGESIAAPLRWNGIERSSAERARRAAELLERVRLPATWSGKLPHELSGGQRQRVGIARALALSPRLLIADEPTSALDVSVQASVIELLTELQSEIGFACLFISHDLSVVEQLASWIIVLQHGRIVEQGTAKEVLGAPRTEYARALVAAVPVPDPAEQRRRTARRRAILAEHADADAV